MAEWPKELPEFVPDGYKETPVSNVLTSSVSGGPPKRRRRFTGSYKNVDLTMLLTPEELVIFEAFFDDHAPDSVPFSMQDPRTSTERLWTIVGDPPYTTTLVNTGARFIQVTLTLQSKPGS